MPSRQTLLYLDNNTFIYKALFLAKPKALYKRYINNI